MDIQTFNNFLEENNVTELTIEVDRNNPPSWKTLSEEIFQTFSEYGVTFKANEDMGDTGDDMVAYGVKGKLKAKGGAEKGEVLNLGKLTPDDQKVLSSIDSKLTQGVKLFVDMEEFLIQYGKVNSRPISDILAKLKAFQEALQNEMGNLS